METCAYSHDFQLFPMLCAETTPTGGGDGQVKSGEFYIPVGERQIPGRTGENMALAKELLFWSEKSSQA
jgi:hypothetical protein